MKRFIISILFAAVFFTGLGGLFEKATANFKSDERALTLIKQAREAIGGDANINNVRSLTIIGKATKTFEMEGIANSEQGDWELNLQLPNQLRKSLKITRGDGAKLSETAELTGKKFDVVVAGKGEAGANTVVTENGEGGTRKVFVMKKDDGVENVIVSPEGENGGRKFTIIKKGDGNAVWSSSDAPDGKDDLMNKKIRVINTEAGQRRQNELFRTTLSLLLSAPEGLDVSYVYAGEGSVDGNSCDIIEANTGGDSYKLYLDKSTHLPRMLTFQGIKPMIFKFKKESGANVEVEKDVKIFTHKTDAPETAEFQVKFSDFRSVSGVQLPYKWTQTVGGKDDETIDVTSYEINPANIAEKFNQPQQKVFIRTKNPE